jgi:hypothetical protein
MNLTRALQAPEETQQERDANKERMNLTRALQAPEETQQERDANAK